MVRRARTDPRVPRAEGTAGTRRLLLAATSTVVAAPAVAAPALRVLGGPGRLVGGLVSGHVEALGGLVGRPVSGLLGLLEVLGRLLEAPHEPAHGHAIDPRDPTEAHVLLALGRHLRRRLSEGLGRRERVPGLCEEPVGDQLGEAIGNQRLAEPPAILTALGKDGCRGVRARAPPP